MTRSPSFGALAATALLGFALVAPASRADDYPAPLRECARNSVVFEGHTPAELRAALAAIPTDMDEYTNCRDLLEAALAKAVGPAPTKRTQVGPGLDPYADGNASSPTGTPAPTGASSPALSDLLAAVASTTPTANATPIPAADVEEPGDADPNAKPLAQPIGSIAAAGIIGASLVVLARPAMLRRRRDQEE